MTISSISASSGVAEAYRAQSALSAQAKHAAPKNPPAGKDTVQISKAALAAAHSAKERDGD